MQPRCRTARIGFFIDYTAQKRDLARYGLEVDPRP